MAFDEHFAQRVRAALADVPEVSERRMFGGLAFLVGGHMTCGVVGGDLMFRLGETAADEALAQPHVRPMDFTGHPMNTMVYVEPAGVSSPDELSRWVWRAITYTRTLPRKPGHS